MRIVIDMITLVPTLERGNKIIFEGEIQLKDSKGKLFSLKPLQENVSPLDIPSLNLNLSTEEIVDTIREMREYHYT